MLLHSANTSRSSRPDLRSTSPRAIDDNLPHQGRCSIRASVGEETIMRKTTLLSLVYFISSVIIGLSNERVAFAQGNTNFGDFSLASVTSGAANSAFGFNALHADTSGSGNTAVGDAAMFST